MVLLYQDSSQAVSSDTPVHYSYQTSGSSEEQLKDYAIQVRAKQLILISDTIYLTFCCSFTVVYNIFAVVHS